MAATVAFAKLICRRDAGAASLQMQHLLQHPKLWSEVARAIIEQALYSITPIMAEAASVVQCIIRQWQRMAYILLWSLVILELPRTLEL